MTYRKLWVWLIKHDRPREKIDGNPTKASFKLYDQKKSKIDVYEAKTATLMIEEENYLI